MQHATPAVTINGTAIPPVIYQDQPVITLAMMDEVHERPAGTAGRNFRTNRSKLNEGEDYVVAGSDEIRRNNPQAIPAATKRNVTLLTESGYLLLVKSFTDDLAWQVQRQLVNGYFKAVGRNQVNIGPETITASEQQTLSEIVHRRADEAAAPGKARAEIWSRLHRKFRIAKYDQLPRTQLADAIVYVTTMDVRASACRKITPLTDEQIKQLDYAIHRATSSHPLREASAKSVVRNRLRVQFNLRSVNELPAEHLPDALALLDELYRVSHAYQAAVREMTDAFTRDVLGGGEPWTPFIKRHLGIKQIGVHPDWRALSQRLLTH